MNQNEMGPAEAKLGNIKRIDIRLVWPNEASDFTPWLAQEQNIARLGEAIGIELEVEKVEASVGPYSADILAKDTGSGEYVVIENQLGKTNHDHLGKAITYGSALSASAIIWIASDFTEEHQKALEWLNDNTTDNLAFYGVQVELWRIDDSKPAVKFNVISRPVESARQAAQIIASENLSATKKLQLDFWGLFRERLLRAKVVPSAQAARPQNWFDVPVGRSNIFLSNIANTWEGRVGVRLYIRQNVAGKALPQLMEQKADIEQDLGMQLAWDPNPDNRDKIIAVFRNADLWNRTTWGEHLDWLVETVDKFRKVFMPRVKNLDLAE